MSKNEQLFLFQNSEVKKERSFIESIGKKLQEERSQWVQKMKPEIIDFCLELCEQILRQALKEPDVLVQKITSLLDALAIGQEPITILLSPQDLEMIEGDPHKKRWGSLYFYSDPTMERGDIRIESSALVINCALRRELASLRAHLLKGEEGC